MDPRHAGELLRHLEKQNEQLMEVYRSMFSEIQKLQVEEEMLMRKSYEFMKSRKSKKLVDCSSADKSIISTEDHTSDK